MPSLSESASISLSRPMWVGSQNDLLRLLRDITKQYDPLIPLHVSEQTDYPSQMLRMAKDEKTELASNSGTESDDSYWTQRRVLEVDSKIEMWTEKLAAASDEASIAGQIKMTLTGKDNERRTVTGEPSELVSYLEGRYIQDLEFEAPSGPIRGHYISLRAGRGRGIYLQVSSTDSRWGIASFTDLKREILAHVPKWRFIRSAAFLYPFFFVISFIGLLAVEEMVATLTTSGGKFEGTASAVAAVLRTLGNVAITTVGVWLTQRQIPGFEVTRSDRASRGSRILATLGSSLGAVLLAVAANALSKVVLG